MLWSLLKVLIFLAIVAAATFGIEQLIATGEGIHIAVMDMEFRLGPLQSIVAVLVLLAVMWIVLKLVGLFVALLRFLLGDETALTRFFHRNRERRGYRALSDSLMALASGETRDALAKANKAEALLQRPELTNLIAAQAAEQSGDTARAQDVYKRLLSDERTRFVGVRGLMKQKLSEGDTDTALKLAEKAFALKPRNAETSDTLFQLQAQKDDWAGARKTLGSKVKHGSLPRDVYRRRDAVLALGLAEDSDVDSVAAQDAAIEANRLSPDFVPGAVAAAGAFVARGKPRNAAKALRTAWSTEPHPDLAAAFAMIAPDETPAQRVSRFADLTKIQPDHPETRMLLAELNIAAEDFPAARRAMGNLVETDPTARSLTLMAAIERGEGSSDDAVIKGWLGRALTASRGPQWVCENCGTAHKSYLAVCSNCGAFDTIAWKTKADAEVMEATSAAGMLPLIIGAVGDQSGPVEGDVSSDAEDVLDGTATAAEPDADAAKQAEKV